MLTEEIVLTGLNTPIRRRNAILLPGDLVIATIEGVLFVPAHMAEQAVSTAEFVIRKDQFGFEMVRTGKYTTGQIDSQWSNEIKIEFIKWLEKHPDDDTSEVQFLFGNIQMHRTDVHGNPLIRQFENRSHSTIFFTFRMKYTL